MPPALAPASIPDGTFSPALAYDPVTFDARCERAGLAPEVVSGALLELGLGGAVERMPGNRYRRLA